MNASTLKALKGSIEKWEKICEGTREDQGMANCPLCAAFADCRSTATRCFKCPVFLKTGHSGCQSTPYMKWNRHQEEVHDCEQNMWLREDCPGCSKFARAELKFLRSLLPKVKK